MATIKSYTDINQSKKLAEILPLKSADYHYIIQGEKSYFYPYSLSSDAIKDYDEEIKYIPCWSLSALLELLPTGCSIDKENIEYVASYVLPHKVYEYSGNNPIDACYEMILKLKELNLL